MFYRSLEAFADAEIIPKQGLSPVMVQPSQESSDMSFGKCDKFVASRFTQFIRTTFPVAPAAHLAAISNQTVRAAERQLSGEVKPSADVITACISAFGPAFIAQCFDAPWAEQAVRDERRKQLQQELALIDA